jgi:hypothetical protein
MEDGRITGEVSIDRQSNGQLLLARNHIVISDEGNDVICLVPYEPDGDECAAYEQLAESIVARLNASQAGAR